jgi:hypothetical protein
VKIQQEINLKLSEIKNTNAKPEVMKLAIATEMIARETGSDRV